LLAVGLEHWTLAIGHVGLVGQLLDRFGLDRRTRRLMLGQIENLRRRDRGRAYVEEQFTRLVADLPEQLNRLGEMQPNIQAAEDIRDNVSQVFELLLESANLGTTGTGRTNEDVARRLLTKQRRANQRGEVSRALDFLEKLTAIEGAPDEAFPALEDLLPDDESIRETARSFRAAVELLAAYGIEQDRIRLQMGLARGLNYYTGIVFEAHTKAGDSASQLCGGGRYDDFIRIMGSAQDTPAIGFAYGLERILQELRRSHEKTDITPTVRALVVPVDDVDNAEAARIAMLLREHVDVELFTPPTRNLSQALAQAGKRGTPYVIIIGSAEREAQNLSVRDMQTKTQFTIPMSQVAELVEKITNHQESSTASDKTRY
jgi:histidyl-tRNA synthetase